MCVCIHIHLTWLRRRIGDVCCVWCIKAVAQHFAVANECLLVRTRRTIGGMINGWVGMMVTGKFRRLSGVATVQNGLDMPGLRNRPRVRKPV